MVEFVIAESKKVFTKALKNFCKQGNKEREEVSLRLYLKGDGDDRSVGYTICYNGVFIKDVSILEVLDVKLQIFDIKGYSLIVPPYLKGFLEGFEQELNSNNVEIFIHFDNIDEDEVRFFLYNNEDFKKEIFLEELLGVE